MGSLNESQINSQKEYTLRIATLDDQTGMLQIFSKTVISILLTFTK